MALEIGLTFGFEPGIIVAPCMGEWRNWQTH
jgi:hypothetical protein